MHQGLVSVEIIHAIDLAADNHSELTGDGIVGYSIGPSKYFVVSMPSLLKQVFAKRATELDKENTLTWFMKVAFQDGNASKKETHAFHADHRVLNLMLRENFVAESTRRTANAVAERASNLISVEHKKLESNLWHRVSNAVVFDEASVDVDFFALCVHFVGDIMGEILYGKAFMDNNPEIIEDLWIFDEGVHRLLTPGLSFTAVARRAIAARTRMIRAMGEWHETMCAVQRGEDPGSRWGKMDDVSQVMQQRSKTFEENKASYKLHTTTNVSTLWGANANSNKIIFWMLLQICSKPKVLADIREEIAPFVAISTDQPKSDEMARLQLDVDGLTRSCPLIKASFYETMRMNMSGMGVRNVNKELILTESAEDAILLGKKRPQSYIIPKGTTLALSNGTMQQDARIFPDPHNFEPRRFLFPDEKDPSKMVAIMRNLNTFGGGNYKCKGRLFAEKEVLIFVAGILTLWDLENPDGGLIQIPEMGPAGASRSPKRDVRIRLRKRF